MPAKRFKEIEYHAEQHRQLTVGAVGAVSGAGEREEEREGERAEERAGEVGGEVGGAKFDFPGYCHVMQAKAEREVIATQMATHKDTSTATHKDMATATGTHKATATEEKEARRMARSEAGAECLGRYLDLTDFTGVYKQTMATLATHLMTLQRFNEALRIFNGIIGSRIKNGFSGGGDGGGGGGGGGGGDAVVLG